MKSTTTLPHVLGLLVAATLIGVVLIALFGRLVWPEVGLLSKNTAALVLAAFFTLHFFVTRREKKQKELKQAQAPQQPK